MYVTTFYSFKGGVGRSMALVNVAVELANRGHTVLAVDFDLEAPGLDTFDLPKPDTPALGIVDFVTEYLSTRNVPAVDRFVYKSPGLGKNNGGVWVMPSGSRSDTYANALTSIDWGQLYDRHNGFFLIEHLKQQWRDCIDPDYVLIDSRTGHTDIGGICTRQLPDSVAILFFPNEQNLLGLDQVVQAIRDEKNTTKKDIRLHFIMSNVPDLDDEDRILARMMSSFERQLRFVDPLVIHRYDSLSLLNQVVFTKDRPRSRLAKEYRILTKNIVRYNPEDPDGAIDFLYNLQSLRRIPRNTTGWTQINEREEHLKKIEEIEWKDGKVLYRLGSYSRLRGDMKEAIEFFDQAIEAGFADPEVFLERAQIRLRVLHDMDGTVQDAKIVVSSPSASSVQVLRAIRIVGPEYMEHVATTGGLDRRSPEELVWIASQLNRSKTEARIAAHVLRSSRSEWPSELSEMATESLSLSNVAIGSFSEAIQEYKAMVQDVSEMGIADAFNYGMAQWGYRNELCREPFERAVICFRQDQQAYQSPNHLQCMAVAHWVVGDNLKARELVQTAREKINKRTTREISCWRYLRVSPVEFVKDLDELLELVAGNDRIRPHFFESR